jgi:hypothetical protein
VIRVLRDIEIAGSNTCNDWKILRRKLVGDADAKLWQDAANGYFYERLSLRYLKPIQILQENGTYQGEGFSIVAIQCSLVEFLEATLKGVRYRYLRKGMKLGPYDYSNSGDLFISFLCNRSPFKTNFNQQVARDFYEGVRCGLLHEATTKNGWTIWAEGPRGKVINASRKIVYRNNFQLALLEFIRNYEQALLSDKALQEAFIRKFDSLCE